MAEIRPIRAWRYHERFSSEIAQLSSPLFDVVSEKQRRKLYANLLNSIHLSVPLGDHPALNAAKTWEQWKKQQIVVQDEKPALYAYYQYFSLPHESKTYCRKGFVCWIKAHFPEERQLLLHENTIPNAVNDRLDILRKTKLNISPTHGLYSDKNFTLEPYLDEAIANPIYDMEDYQGVRNVLAKIENPVIIDIFVRHLRTEKVILADGHHRLESSITYRREQMTQSPQSTGNELYHYHLIYLTNMESNDLRILPTHRLLSGLPLSVLQKDTLLEKARKYFHITELADADNIDEIIAGKKWTFGVVVQDNVFKFRLKEEVFPMLSWNFPPQVKAMDLTVMHYFIIEKLFGIRGKDQRNTPHISFERNLHHCLSLVEQGAAQVALITNEIDINQVKEICYSGYTLPQKSTYFYPKVVCGLLFGDISETNV